MRKTRYTGDFLKLTVKRAFGMRFVLSLFLVCLCFFLDTEVSARDVLLGIYPAEDYEGIALYVEGILMYGMNYKLFLVFMTMGFAATLPLDWKAGIVPRLVKDLELRKYAHMHVGISALSGGLSVVGGFTLYLLWMKTKYPLLPAGFQTNGAYEFLEGMPYYSGLTQHDARMFVFFLMMIFFLSGVTWTALAAGVSIYFKSSYLVLVFPYLLSRSYIEIAKAFQFPNEIRIDRWFTAMVQPFPIPVCLGIMTVFCLLTCIFSKHVFLMSIKWRLENG